MSCRLALRCLACGALGAAPTRKALCRACWEQLPDETRRRLLEGGPAAAERRRFRQFQLLSAIRRGVALAEIQVSER